MSGGRTGIVKQERNLWRQSKAVLSQSLHLNYSLGDRLAEGRKVVKCCSPHLGADTERVEFHKGFVDWLGDELSNHLRL